jgi:hypothetical protein
MKSHRKCCSLVVCGALSLSGAGLVAAQQTVNPPAPPTSSSDRLLLSGNASRLSDDIHGDGGQIAWLHDADRLHFNVGGEYQSIENSHWAFGSLTAAYTAADSAHSSVFAEVHEGNGRGGQNLPTFRYSVVAGGYSRALASHLTLQLEDRDFNVDTAHGNLPKIGLALPWTARLLSTLSYARSVSGNLQTEVALVRLDLYGANWNALVGAATGHAAPVVVNLQPGFNVEERNNLNEGFVGASRALGRGQLQLVFDYLDLGGRKRGTVTASLTLPLDSGRR